MRGDSKGEEEVPVLSSMAVVGVVGAVAKGDWVGEDTGEGAGEDAVSDCIILC